MNKKGEVDFSFFFFRWLNKPLYIYQHIINSKVNCQYSRHVYIIKNKINPLSFWTNKPNQPENLNFNQWLVSDTAFHSTIQTQYRNKRREREIGRLLISKMEVDEIYTHIHKIDEKRFREKSKACFSWWTTTDSLKTTAYGVILFVIEIKPACNRLVVGHLKRCARGICEIFHL